VIRIAEEKARKRKERFPSKEKIRQDPSFADVASFLVGLISRVFFSITGKELQEDAEKAFAYFLVFFSLIIGIVGWPKNLSDLMHIYWGAPLVFLLYSVFVAGQNWKQINRFFKKFQQRTELAFIDIIEDRVHHDDLEILLSTMSFNLDQIEEIIEHLKKRDQFTPNAQCSLLSNKKVYGTEIFPFIKDSLISEDWESSAICIFLIESEGRLDEEYIKKLIEKYKGRKSIIFCVGRYYNYKPELSQEEKRYFDVGFNFQIKKMRVSKLLYNSYPWIFLIIFISTSLFFGIKLSSFLSVSVTFFPIFLIFIVIYLFGLNWIFTPIFNWILNIIFKDEVRKELKKQGIEISPFELEKFDRDLPGF